MQPQEQPPTWQPPAPVPTPQPSNEGQPKVNNPLAAMREGERVICEIKRHPFGMFGLYASVAVILILVTIFGFGFAPSIITSVSKGELYGYSTIALLVAVMFSAIALAVGHVVYWGNRWIVTDDSITQIVQIGLFNKQSSQLSMANLEDVTTEQRGILAHMFNFGVLKAETAGEHSKFRLAYCPNPNYYAKCILEARESFEQENYRNNAVPSQPTPQSQPPQQVQQ